MLPILNIILTLDKLSEVNTVVGKWLGEKRLLTHRLMMLVLPVPGFPSTSPL